MGVVYVFLIQTNPAWIEIGIVFVHEQYIRGQTMVSFRKKRMMYEWLWSYKDLKKLSFFKTNEKKTKRLNIVWTILKNDRFYNMNKCSKRFFKKCSFLIKFLKRLIFYWANNFLNDCTVEKNDNFEH